MTLLHAEPDVSRSLLRSGEADLGLLRNWTDESLPKGEESMTRIPLLTDRRCAVVPRDHPLAAQTEMDLAALADADWVMESARDRFEAACAAAYFTPKIAATSDDQVTIQNLVAARLGVTLMTDLALTAHLDRRVVARPLRDWPRRSSYALLWPDMAEVPAVRAVLHAVRACARDIPVCLRDTGAVPAR